MESAPELAAFYLVMHRIDWVSLPVCDSVCGHGGCRDEDGDHQYVENGKELRF